MKYILKRLRKNRKLHSKIRNLYGRTIGLWALKDWFATNIGFWNGKKRIKLCGKKEGEEIIRKALVSGKPFAFGRFGSTEFRNMFYNEIETLCFYSGFFPCDKKLLKKFRNIYFDAAKYIDILAVWNYRNKFLNKIKTIHKMSSLRYIVPLDVLVDDDLLWVKGLKGKRVLVVHPFKATILKQMKKRKQLGILPKLKSIEVIKAVQTLAGEKDPRFNNWFEALDYMKKEIDKKDFDVAIIGCGAYGLPLAAHIKKKGKQALHTAGSTQLLFGIIGQRWERGDEESRGWIRPLDEDKLKKGKSIEDGCYW